MWRKAVVFSIAAMALLCAGPSQAALVQLTFEGTGYEYYYTYAPDLYDEWSGDPFDVTLNLLFDVTGVTQGPLPGDPSWDLTHAQGTFVSGHATSGSSTLDFSADQLMTYPNQYNEAYADYATNGSQWWLNGSAMAGSWDAYGNGLVIAQGVGGSLYAYGNSETQQIPAVMGALYDWQSIGLPTEAPQARQPGGDGIFYSEHGLAFEGLYTGSRIVPEPATVTLLGLGLSGMGLRVLRRRRAA